jgi:lysozyme
MADIRLADISEWQSSIDAPAYIAGGHKSIVVRAHSGHRADKCWPQRRDYLRSQPLVALGFYQYMVASRDAAQQAREFVDCVGALRGNEFAVLDSEEGSGSQISRCEAWFAVVDRAYGLPSALYASDAWFRDKLGGSARWSNRARWVAAYPSSYTPSPTAEAKLVAHELWQFSDRERFPGLAGGVDGNIYHGTDQQFLAAMRRGDVEPPPEPEDYVAITAAQNAGQSLHVFVEAKDGSIWYTYQSKGKTAWNGGQAGKKVAGLVKFAPAPGK